MKYYKIMDNEYILSIGMSENIIGKEITKSEYDNLRDIIKNRPFEEGYYYRLKEDLTWEKHELPIIAETEEVTE